MANKKIPLRKCVGCNAMKEKKEMIRVIKTPENEIVSMPPVVKRPWGIHLCRSGVPSSGKKIQRTRALP